MELNKKYLFSFSVILFCFLLDRVSKVYILNFFLSMSHDQYYLNDYLNLVLFWNKGIAFGLLQSEAIIYDIISIIIFFILLFLAYLIYKTIFVYENVCFSMILGGAIGNFVDRIYFGAVPDFIDLHLDSFHWFTFNVSDIFITLGAIILLICDIFKNLQKND